ncbi:ROK family transcriptional regulator [Microlunatus panaciterrae]|uniref:NBD/HSP70 family sugar kinase n=1 Tax=Microlunatus panaciterrae TaxID=400768 RepID=A0ABS2RFH6_9ACTN|nr:ROK family transcriptional regulator [Microlunatus panaciterrae]MBM7797759.1 putative NBD/HSP70 family sugar kinase [Microlunatus panaciterrae]
MVGALREDWEPLDGSALAVALAVLRSGPIARAELARKLDLSSGSLTRLTRPLIAQGLLVERAPQLFARTGRPSLPLDVVAESASFIGVKITDDTVYAVVTDLRGDLIDRVEAPLVQTDPQSTVEIISGLAEDLRGRYDRVAGIGIGLAGVIEQRRLVLRAPILGWEHFPLADAVTARTGLTCTVENDVKAFTQAEHWFGAGRGLTSFVVLTVGAGIGCGLVVHDQIVRGHHGVAGAVGHLPLRTEGARCELGHVGCARAVLTSGSISRQLTSRRRRSTTFDQALELYRAGNPFAVELLDEAAYRLGILAGTVANVIGPERMLLSGEGIGFALLAPDTVRRGLREVAHWSLGELDLVVEPLEFFEWARGGAAIAILTHVIRHQGHN